MNRQLKHLLIGTTLTLSILASTNSYSYWVYNNYTGRYVWVNPGNYPNFNSQRNSTSNPCSIYTGTLASAMIAQTSGCNSSQVNRAASQGKKMLDYSIKSLQQR